MHPLTATPALAADEIARLAARALAAWRDSADGADDGLWSAPDVPGTFACRLGPRGRPSGVLLFLCTGTATPDMHQRTRLLAIADRIGVALEGKRLYAELETKERGLRRAYRELKASGRRLARSRAQEEAGAVGRAASMALAKPVAAVVKELRRLERQVARGDSAGLKDAIARLRTNLDEIQSCGRELFDIVRNAGSPTQVDVNEALVAALDLAAPDLRRAGIETRVSLAPDLRRVLLDEATFARVLSRVLQRARASLRRVPAPRRLTLATHAHGEGVRITVTDNGAGLRGAARAASSDAPSGSTLRRALARSHKALLRADLAAHGIAMRTESELGQGRTTTIHVRGTPRAADRSADAATRAPGRGARGRHGALL
jgi:hypothetical protein